jgi:hypothetical protein
MATSSSDHAVITEALQKPTTEEGVSHVMKHFYVNKLNCPAVGPCDKAAADRAQYLVRIMREDLRHLIDHARQLADRFGVGAEGSEEIKRMWHEAVARLLHDYMLEGVVAFDGV